MLWGTEWRTLNAQSIEQTVSRVAQWLTKRQA